MPVRLPRLRLPNTRAGAITAAAGLTLFGFLVGIVLLLVVPPARAGQGPLAFLFRQRAGLEARPGGLQPVPTRRSAERPELWLTPTALAAFPSEQQQSALSRSSGAARGTYDPRTSQRVLALPPIRDAVGRPIVTLVAALSSSEDVRTPAPLRPQPAEPTEVTLAASTPSSPEPAGCVVAIGRSGRLEVARVFGGARAEDCSSGQLEAPDGTRLVFAVLGELLPNYRTNDGTWRDGAVLGRTQLWVGAASITGASSPRQTYGVGGAGSGSRSA